MRSTLIRIGTLLVGLFIVATPVSASPINFRLALDDHGTLAINGAPLITLSCGGSCSGSALVDLPGGWYSIEMTYQNFHGSTNFFFLEDFTLGGVEQIVPRSWLRSLDASGAYVSGLRADYYNLAGTTFLGTVYGEGPIAHGYNAGYPYWYQGVTNASGSGWGPFIADAGWGIFTERLSGEIYLPGAAVPEPASLLLLGTGLAGLVAWRRRRR